MAFIPASSSVVAFQSNPANLQASVTGTVAITGSVIAVTTAVANQSISGTVIANQGTNPWVITGSVQGSFSPAANQSVSGTVGASIIGLPPVNVTNTNLNISGSVAAWLQSTNASVITIGTAVANQSVSGTVGASVIGNVPVVVQSSIAAVIIGGSIAASFTPPANQSVSGAVSVSNFPTTQNVSGSVVATQGTNPWIITGSVQGSFTAAANQSVSGTVGASILGNVNTTITSVATTGGFLNVNLVGGSILTSSTPNQSVSGTVQAQVQGSIAAVIIGGSIAASFIPPANQSVSGAVSISNFPTTQNVSGSVVATQGTNPWIITGSVQGTFSAGNSSVQVLNFPTNQSVSGTVGSSIIGTVPVTQSTSPWTVVSSLAGGIFPISGSVAATITNTNINVSGSVAAFLAGSTNASIITVGTAAPNQSVSGTVHVDNFASVISYQLAGSILATSATVNPSANQSVSGTVGASIIGQLPAGTAMLGSVVAYQGAIPWSIGSVYGNISGSVAATITNTNVNVSGSVVAFQGAGWSGSVAATIVGQPITVTPNFSSVITIFSSPSIVGTYADDSPSGSGDKGIFVLAVRNDTMSSVESSDGDYSEFAVGPVGEMLTANSPITKWVYGTTSIVSGASVALMAAQGASVFTYITGLNVVNTSANNFYGNLSTGAGAASVLAYFVAPANGGSNMVFPNPLRSRDNTAILASISGVGSVYLSAQGFIAKT